MQDSHALCCTKINEFFAKLETLGMGQHLEHLMKDEVRMRALSSWLVDHIRRHLKFTPILLNLIFGEGYWINAFGAPPVKRDSGDNIYEDARRRTSRFINDRAREPGSFAALDVNTAAFEGSNMLAEQMLLHYGFMIFLDFSPLQLAAYVYREEGKRPSFIFLHRPPCYMAHTSLDTPTTPELADRMQKRAVEFHLIHLLSDILQEKDVTSLRPDRSLRNYPVFKNILVGHAIFVGFIWNLHIGRMYACLVFKNFLIGLSCNAFDRQYHGMSISGGNYLTVAHNLRNNIRRPDHGNGVVDTFWHVRVLNILSC